jgi:hypothetical protein
MLYRFNKARQTRKLNRAIGGILDTPPLRTEPAPWCIASMVANSDVAMYLLSLKSFYLKLRRGKVAVIIDRDMPQATRDVLSHHVPGIEFVILEDIPTGTCQRGGTWERLLHVLDRSEHEYTIQLDADTLTVGEIDEVIRCAETNTPFTMSDGFELLPLPEVAEEAEATPSNYIGIVTERLFACYPDAGLHYVRGSSGLAGFSRGGFTRAAITRFHEEMEKLVGASRWREWGTEQCGSNFAISNSPGAVVLPYPDYASFLPDAPREAVRFFHFIGTYRFRDNYYAARGQEVIAKLRQGSMPIVKANPPRRREDAWSLAFTRALTPLSAVRYLSWRLGGRRSNIWVRLHSRSDVPGPTFQLRRRSTGSRDVEAACEIFINKSLQAPVRMPPERVKLIVEFGADDGMSSLYWLATFWRAEVLAFESRPQRAAQWRSNLHHNRFLTRAKLHSEVTDPLALLVGRRIDILKINGSYCELLTDPRFRQLDVRAVVLKWDETVAENDEYAMCSRILQESGFQLTPMLPQKTLRIAWAYKKRPIARSRVNPSSSSVGTTGATLAG